MLVHSSKNETSSEWTHLEQTLIYSPGLNIFLHVKNSANCIASAKFSKDGLQAYSLRQSQCFKLACLRCDKRNWLQRQSNCWIVNTFFQLSINTRIKRIIHFCLLLSFNSTHYMSNDVVMFVKNSGNIYSEELVIYHANTQWNNSSNNFTLVYARVSKFYTFDPSTLQIS